MDIEEIKIGEMYLLPVKVTAIEKTGWLEVATFNNSKYRLAPSEVRTLRRKEASASSHINPYPPLNIPIMTEIPETYPKYDPRRLFRKGDAVRPVERYGRKPDDGAPENVICEVVEDERKNGTVPIRYRGKNGISVRFTVTALYLELVTPVEELEPYYVEQQGEKTGGFCFTVRKRTGYCESTFYFGAARSRDKQQAKAAAEAECDRLNAEYRKEQK